MKIYIVAANKHSTPSPPVKISFGEKGLLHDKGEVETIFQFK